MHQEAADITKTYIYSLSHLPAQCEGWFSGGLGPALNHLQAISGKVYDAMMIFPSETTAYDKLGEIRTSIRDIYYDLRDSDKCGRDLSKNSGNCVNLVKEMMGTFETFNFTATPFQVIASFSKFLTSFAGFFNSHAHDEAMKRYEMRIQGLTLRRAELKSKDKN